MKKGFILDLFKGPGNEHWDLGRISAGFAIFITFCGAVWNVLLGLPLELGPTGFPGGLALVLGGAAALIYAKDKAKADNTVARAMSTTADTEGTLADTASRRQLKEK
jgi:hypothetical protein